MPLEGYMYMQLVCVIYKLVLLCTDAKMKKWFYLYEMMHST